MFLLNKFNWNRESVSALGMIDKPTSEVTKQASVLMHAARDSHLSRHIQGKSVLYYVNV